MVHSGPIYASPTAVYASRLGRAPNSRGAAADRCHICASRPCTRACYAGAGPIESGHHARPPAQQAQAVLVVHSGPIHASPTAVYASRLGRAPNSCGAAADRCHVRARARSTGVGPIYATPPAVYASRLGRASNSRGVAAGRCHLYASRPCTRARCAGEGPIESGHHDVPTHARPPARSANPGSASGPFGADPRLPNRRVCT